MMKLKGIGFIYYCIRIIPMRDYLTLTFFTKKCISNLFRFEINFFLLLIKWTSLKFTKAVPRKYSDT